MPNGSARDHPGCKDAVRRPVGLLVLALLFGWIGLAHGEVPAESKACVDCHAKTSAGLVREWEHSRHSTVGIGCSVCHIQEYEREIRLVRKFADRGLRRRNRRQEAKTTFRRPKDLLGHLGVHGDAQDADPNAIALDDSREIASDPDLHRPVPDRGQRSASSGLDRRLLGGGPPLQAGAAQGETTTVLPCGMLGTPIAAQTFVRRVGAMEPTGLRFEVP